MIYFFIITKFIINSKLNIYLVTHYYLMSNDFDLISADSRTVALPVGRPELYNMYKHALGCFWITEEISFEEDATQFPKLSPAIKQAIMTIIGWFASSDGRVVTNLSERFIKEIPIYEVTRFFNVQNTMEDIHAETYARNIEEIIPDKASRDKLFMALDTMPIIKRMNDYADSTTSSDDKLAIRLLKFACIEGIWFTGCFAFIDWLNEKNLMPGLCHANRLISRDEGLHTDFGLKLITLIKPTRNLTGEEAHYYVSEAIAIGCNFISEMLPKQELIGMNAKFMTKHIQSKADDMLMKIRHKVIWNIPSPFTFSDRRGLLGKTGFFEQRVADYAKASSSTADDEIDTDV